MQHFVPQQKRVSFQLYTKKPKHKYPHMGVLISGVHFRHGTNEHRVVRVPHTCNQPAVKSPPSNVTVHMHTFTWVVCVFRSYANRGNLLLSPLDDTNTRSSEQTTMPLDSYAPVLVFGKYVWSLLCFRVMSDIYAPAQETGHVHHAQIRETFCCGFIVAVCFVFIVVGQTTKLNTSYAEIVHIQTLRQTSCNRTAHGPKWHEYM